MKKQITLLSLIMVFAITLFSCKKDTESVKARIMGKWNITKVDISGYTAADLAAGIAANDKTKVNATVTGLSGDYLDFKSNNDDQVEQNLLGVRSIGTYLGTGDSFNMSFPEGDYYCTLTELTTSKLQFTAKLNKTSVVKVYYLTR